MDVGSQYQSQVSAHSDFVNWITIPSPRWTSQPTVVLTPETRHLKRLASQNGTLAFDHDLRAKLPAPGRLRGTIL